MRKIQGGREEESGKTRHFFPGTNRGRCVCVCVMVCVFVQRHAWRSNSA